MFRASFPFFNRATLGYPVSFLLFIHRNQLTFIHTTRATDSLYPTQVIRCFPRSIMFVSGWKEKKLEMDVQEEGRMNMGMLNWLSKWFAYG